METLAGVATRGVVPHVSTMAEKSSSEVALHCREQFEKGMAAYNRQNYDYAIDILSGLLQLEPAYYDAREALRATQFKRAKAEKGFFSKVLGKASMSPTLAKAQMLAKRKPLEALVAAEQVLNVDPGNSAAHRALAEAAAAAGLLKTALLSLEIAFKNNPADRKLALQLADACANAGQIARAEGIYQEALKANPADPDLLQALKDLAARRTLAEGGYDSLADGKGSFRDILRDKNQAVQLEQEGRVVKSDEATRELLARYTAQLRAEPDNAKLMRSAAEALGQLSEFSQARELLSRLREISGAADPSLDKQILVLALKQLDQQANGLDPDGVDFEEQRRKLLGERQELEIRAARDMVERYPSDLQYRFELGQIYFRLGRINEAIAEFQKSQNNPHRRVASLGYLGQCFSRRGLHDVAIRTLQKAVDEKANFDEEKKELIYQLGMAWETMGKRNEAIEQFKKIYEVDIGYRDVGARVDAFYSGEAR